MLSTYTYTQDLNCWLHIHVHTCLYIYIHTHITHTCSYIYIHTHITHTCWYIYKHTTFANRYKTITSAANNRQGINVPLYGHHARHHVSKQQSNSNTGLSWIKKINAHHIKQHIPPTSFLLSWHVTGSDVANKTTTPRGIVVMGVPLYAHHARHPVSKQQSNSMQ
eukprot:GHVS01004300.1.p1 GENE.GHVS01004300.1~~GHVS01004300.1.p1  ORF type:complete len:165 (+),score=8.21 GHVS01004300.1:212-706(+)